MNLSPFPHSPSISSFSLHFLTLSPFPLPPSISSLSLHFLAARLQGCSKLCNPGTIWQLLGDISGTSWWRMGTTVGQCRKKTGATQGLEISIKVFVMVWVETAECPLSLFLFVCFNKHLVRSASSF